MVDDHEIVRAGLRMLLQSQPDIEIVAEADNGRDAIAKAKECKPDIVLMDISLPDIDGFEATRQIKHALPSVAILALTMHETDEYFFKGFPDYWNIMVIYMLIMQLNQWINFAFLIFFAILVFVPVKYIYPTRTVRLKKLTLALTYIYAGIGLIGLILFPNVPAWIIYASFVYMAYYVGLSLWPKSKITT